MNTIKEKTLEVNYDDVYKFFDTVHRLICNDMKLDYDLGKDLCQEGFIKAFIKMETLKCSTTCKKTKDLIIFTWIKTIVKNTIIDYFRSPKNNGKIEYNPLYHDQFSQTELDNEEDFLFKDKFTKEQLIMAVEMLSYSQKISFEKFVIEEKSHKEIAQELGISEGTSKSNFFRAKNNIIKNLKKVI